MPDTRPAPTPDAGSGPTTSSGKACGQQRPLGRVGLVAVLAGLLAAVVPATPAWAHAADAPSGTNYRTAITGLTPTVPGLTVRTVEAGARLELINHTGHTIEVLGYSEEPYLEVRPDGVYENLNSPATYLNQTLAGDTPVPDRAAPAAAPEWRRTSQTPVVRWHDHRTAWMEDTPPPLVRAAPGQRHRVRDWVVSLRSGVSTIEVHGTLDWLPPPQPGPWWGLSLLSAAAVASLGLLTGAVPAGPRPAPGPGPGLPAPYPAPGRPAAGRWSARRTAAVLAGLALGTGALLALGYATAREVGAGVRGAGLASGVLLAQTWPLLTALGALVACGLVLLRRPAADFALALAGGCLLVAAGLPNVTVFSHSVVPVPGDPVWARTTVALVTGLAAGAVGAGVLRLRAAAHRAAPGANTSARLPGAASPSHPGPTTPGTT